MANIIIFGTGQLAEVICHYIETDSGDSVIAFTVDQDYRTQEYLHGLPVVSYEDLEHEFPPEDATLLIPISYKGMNKVREKKYLDAKRKGYKFATYISSKAACHTSVIGENTIILENNVIQPFATIGNNCIVWSGNHIGHHSKVNDHCFISSHVVVSGGVTIGEYCFLGVNSTIRDNISVGKANLVGAGSLILRDTPDNSVFPAVGTVKSRVSSDRLRSI